MADTIAELPLDSVIDRSGYSILYTCIEDILTYPKNAQLKLQTIKNTINGIPEEDRLNVLLKEAEKKRGETVLHTAIKLFNCKSKVEMEVIEFLAGSFPKLILQDRGNTEYSGQTPLHMAVCKGNIWTVNTLLQEISKKENKHWKSSLFKKRANGVIFQNTVMMGELPLSIAALTLNKGMFDMLLANGAELDGVNRSRDNLCHSLIRYAFLYQEKLPDILDMCRYISEDPSPYDTGNKTTKNRKLRKKIWIMENDEGLNPLQLSAKLGQHELFGYIMDLEAYCFRNTKDGLFDIKIYDVTDIDAIASMRHEEIVGAEVNVRKISLPENMPIRRAVTSEIKPYTKSILMMLLELEPTCAFHFLQFPQLRRIIDQKWYTYQMLLYPWWIIHVIYMCFLTWYSVERAQQTYNNGSSYDVDRAPIFKREMIKDGFVTAFGVVCLIVAIMYLAQEIVRMVKGKMPWNLNSFFNPYSNGWFRLMFCVLSLSLVTDFIVSIWSVYYENYCLIVAVVVGWFSVIFFLRVVRPFSFFTVLIQRVLVGDMFRFFVILGLELLAFGTALFMVIQGSTASDDVDFSDFGHVLFSMFKLMVGLGEIAALYDTRHPSLAILIFVGFVIMTTLLMLNALIALMSKTCSELVENVGNISARDRHWKLQRLSVTLFIESILPKGMIVKVGNEREVIRYNNQIHRRKKMKRYMLEVRSLQNETENSEETISSWGFRTAVFNALRNKTGYQGERERPLSGVSDKIRHMFKRRNKSKVKSPGDVLKSENVSYVTQEPSVHANANLMQDPGNHGLRPYTPFNLPNDVVDFVAEPPAHRPSVLEIYNVSKCNNCSDIKVAGSK